MKLFRPFILLLLLLISSKSLAQIHGKVFDAEAQSPLSGAVISCLDEQTVSGNDGVFKIHSPAKSTLIISHLGYKTDSFQVSAQQDEIVIYLIPDYSQLEEVTIRGPLLQNSLMNLPSSISMLHSTDLMQTQSISYMEELNRLPGVFVHSGTINTNRVTIRGIGSRTPYGSNRVKAYFNDIPLTSGDGTTSIEDIDPAMINTIEIIKGSKSAVYGSGLGGIIMLSGREYLEEGFHGKAGIEAGPFGTLNPQLSLQFKKGKLSISAAYSLARNDGWRQNSNYYRHSANVYASYKTKRNKTDVLLHFIDMKAYIPSSLNEETFNNTPDSAAKNWLAVKGFEEYMRLLSGIRNEFKITDRLSNTSVLFLNYYNGYESRPFNILDDDALQGGIKSYMNYTPGAWRFRAGIELMIEKYNWQIYETLDGVQGELQNSYAEARNPLSLFLHGAFSFNNGGIVEAGLSYNFLRYTLTDLLPDSINRSGNYQYDPVFSPFLGMNFPLGSNIRIYASVGHGFSYPGVEETLLPDGQANPDLLPESGINMETGTRLSFFGGKLFADATVYLLLVENLLVTERESEDVFYGRNAGKTRHMGFEVSSRMHLNEKSVSLLPQTRLELSFTLANNQFTNFIDEGIDYTGNALPGIPTTHFFAGASFSYRIGLYAHIQYIYTGMQYLDDGNTASYSAYNLAHLKLGYKLGGKRLHTDFYFGIQNLINTHYASGLLINAPSFRGAAPRYYYPGMPRNFYLGASVLF